MHIILPIKLERNVIHGIPGNYHLGTKKCRAILTRVLKRLLFGTRRILNFILRMLLCKSVIRNIF